MEDWNFNGNQKKGWNTGTSLNCATNCSWSDTQKPSFQIFLSKEVCQVIKQLCNEVKVEWQMLLTGVASESGIIVTGYYIPKQEVTASSVKNLDCIDSEFIEQNRVVATIHSHADMGVFFSTVDEQYTNSSIIKTHLVVNNKYEFVSCTRIKIPCGMDKFISCQIIFEQDPSVQVSGLDNIVKKTYSYQLNEPVNWWERETDDGIRDMHGHKLRNNDEPLDKFKLNNSRRNRKNKKKGMLHVGY